MRRWLQDRRDNLDRWDTWALAWLVVMILLTTGTAAGYRPAVDLSFVGIITAIWLGLIPWLVHSWRELNRMTKKSREDAARVRSMLDRESEGDWP